MICTCNIDTPLGPMTAAASDDQLIGLWFVGQKHYPAEAQTWVNQSNHPILVALRTWIAEYFRGKAGRPELSLSPRGTAFQQAVWEILLRVPHGATITYGDIARQLAAARGLPSMSAQAVGGAVGRNPISILIPCHRVVGADGSLTGYAGGMDKKQALLQLEGAGESPPIQKNP
jgi:methylated-DNA-[protein]-cysteine S-methyltransferase